jgi:hypothetical protein
MAAGISGLESVVATPFAAGPGDCHDFGAGAYERITALAHGAVDPADPRNAGIIDLGLAPRNAAGLVEYSTEVALLRPVDPARSSGRLVHDVTNRGRKRVMGNLYDAVVDPAAANALEVAEAAGNGMGLRAGASYSWCGWDPETPRANGNLRISIPTLEGLTGPCRDEFVFGTRITPADRPTAPLSYPAVMAAGGRLTVKRMRDGAASEVAWEFAGDRAIRLLPAGTPFERGSIYEFSYTATGARALGIGLLATRDLVEFLRRDPASPLAAHRPRTVLGVGISQSGRFLRHFIGLGLNADSAGRRVFDGVLTHVAGAGRVFMNERFAQPDRTACWHEDFAFPEVWFPIAAAPSRDPSTGAVAALLPGAPTDPLLMESNTSTEYWQKGASLIHTTPEATADLPEHPGARHYLISGTKHGAAAGLTTAKGNATNPNNPHNPGPALRALLEALAAWVEHGTPPPPSRVPRLADGTLVPAAEVLAAFPKLPGLALPRFATQVAPVADWVAGRHAETNWRCLVPAVDADGNERAGIRLPDIAAPRGSHTGWNLYAAAGLGGELADREGTFLAFPAQPDPEDPRASLAQRYPDRAAYVAAVKAAAEALVRDRLLLPEDAAWFEARAAAEGPVPPA